MFIEGARIQDKTIWIVGHNDGLQALASLLRRARAGLDIAPLRSNHCGGVGTCWLDVAACRSPCAEGAL